jgi:hypothetical protein
MPVSDVTFQPLVDWCNAAPPSPVLVPKVGVYVQTAEHNEGGDTVTGQFEGVLSYVPGRGNRFRPPHLAGVVRSVSNPFAVATVSITLGQPAEDLIALSFVGGSNNGKFIEVDAGINDLSFDPKVVTLLFDGEKFADVVPRYEVDLWPTYSYVLAP